MKKLLRDMHLMKIFIDEIMQIINENKNSNIKH